MGNCLVVESQCDKVKVLLVKIECSRVINFICNFVLNMTSGNSLLHTYDCDSIKLWNFLFA